MRVLCISELCVSELYANCVEVLYECCAGNRSV